MERKLKGLWTKEMSEAMFQEYTAHIWIPNPVVGNIFIESLNFKYKIVKVTNAPAGYEYPKAYIDMEYLGEGEDKGKIFTFYNHPSNNFKNTLESYYYDDAGNIMI